MVCHFGANEVARVSFIKAGGPKEALSSLIIGAYSKRSCI